MDRAPLNFAFSSCPNDTFAFHALVHGLVPGPRVVPHIDDVEALNARAERGEAEVTKISIAAYGRIRDRYALLRAGGAAGFGVGPIVVARSARTVGGRVAIPGERTTAALLLRLLGRFQTVPMRFDQIEPAVLRGEVDCGVLIHEGRFHVSGEGTDAAGGSRRRVGSTDEMPAAAGGHRDTARSGGSAGAILDRALRASVEYAFTHPDASRKYVAEHAQEMDASVVAKHIQLYVNDYTVALDERAVHALLDWQSNKDRRSRPQRFTDFGWRLN